MNFCDELTNYIKARYPLIFLQTTEESRLFDDIKKIAKSLNHYVVTWSSVDGVQGKGVEIGNQEYTLDIEIAIKACEKCAQTGNPIIFVFFEPSLRGHERSFKEFSMRIRQNGYRCNCILISPQLEINEFIASELTVLDYPLPNKDDIQKQIKKFIKEYKDEENIKIDASTETLNALTEAALGLTYEEIENCLSRALVEDRCLDISDVKSIVKEKKQIIRKSGILEYIENNLSLDDIGGLDYLKHWLEIRGKTFSEDAQNFGISAPKGVLLVGIPGCGKSLTAKCIAKSWNMPLLKLDIGKVYGKYIGESEANIRQAIKTAEAIAPCVLWIDEIEKGLAKENSDSGTASRVLGNILSWMQDKTAPVFTFATANNLVDLPPELLRKGRFDEIFFVDLPNFEERKKILEIHIKRIGREISDFNLDKLSKLSGETNFGKDICLSGAELEVWVRDALLEAYTRKMNGEKNPDLSMNDFETVLKHIVPMAKMQMSNFVALRNWAKENAINASIHTDK